MKVLAILGALAVLACALYASDKVQPKHGAAEPTLPKGTPAKQVAALIQQHKQAMAAFRKVFDAAKTEEEQDKLASLYPNPDAYAALLLQIAEQNRKDAAAIDALLWVARNARPSPRQKDSLFMKAKTTLVGEYLTDPKVGPLCLVLRREFQDPDALRVIRCVLDNNPGKEAQAQAAYSLAKLLQSRANWARTLKKADSQGLANLERAFGKEVVADLQGAHAEALDEEVEALLEKVNKEKDYAATLIDYGDSRVKLGDLAGRELFEIRHLQPGKPAPEIAGEDIDGKPMKLSDFRGRVVLLDFWGHW